MKNRKISLMVMMGILLMALVGCGGGDGKAESGNTDNTVVSGEKLAAIKESGKLVLGTSTDYAPYEFKKKIDGEEKVIGADIEVAKRIAEDLGVELEVVDMEFDKLMPSLDSDEVDIVIASIVSTADREKQCIMSKPYYNTEMVFLIKAEDLEKYNTIDDLADKKIGYKEESIEKVVYKNEFVEIRGMSVGFSSDLVKMVEKDQLQGALMLKAIAEDYVKNNDKLAISNIELDYSRGVIAAVKTGNDDLLGEVNKSIDKMTEENAVHGFMVEAMKEWEGR